MNIELTKQTRLLTKNKACREDIDIIPVLQTKTVTENGTVEPDAGYVGLGKVIVSMPEATGSVLENLAKPQVAKFGRLKYFEDGMKAVRYKDVYPTSSFTYESGVHTGSKRCSAQITLDLYAQMYMGADGQSAVNAPEYAYERFVVDGKVYEGTYGGSVAAMWADRGMLGGRAHLSEIHIPACVMKVYLFNPADNTLLTKETTVGEEYLEEQEIQVADMYNMAHSYCTINCQTMGVYGLIGAEFVYEKHNITLSGGVGQLKVSVDDGATFTPVTEGMTFSQVEHLVFENITDAAVLIGNQEGGGEYGAVEAGSTFVLPARESGTWYIS